jgi:hypothetical protein
VSPGRSWERLLGTLGPVALVAQGIEQRFPNPYGSRPPQVADVRFRIVETRYSAHVGPGCARQSDICRSMILFGRESMRVYRLVSIRAAWSASIASMTGSRGDEGTAVQANVRVVRQSQLAHADFRFAIVGGP